MIPALASTLDTSSIAKAYVNTSAPSPPYSLEYGIPIRPYFFILSNRSISNFSASSISLEIGLISFSAKLLNNSFASSCSFVNLNSTILFILLSGQNNLPVIFFVCFIFCVPILCTLII